MARAPSNPVKRVPKQYTKIRKAFEERQQNILFHRAVRNAQDRANLRMERDRLHGLLHTSINPGLRERVNKAKIDISTILGD